MPSFDTNTVIKAYYGNANPPAVTASDVWSNGYLGVWHLGAAGNTTQRNSATNAFDLTRAAADAGKVDLSVSDGAIGGAVGFNRDDTKKGALTAEDPNDVLAGSDDITVEAWIYPMAVDADNNRAILAKRIAYGAQTTFYIYANKSRDGVPNMTVATGPDNGTTVYPAGPTTAFAPPLNAWTHVACTRTGDNAKLTYYLGGTNALATTAGGVGSLYKGAGYPFVVGNDKSTIGSAYPGNIDEVRISNVARSADWVRATRDCVQETGFSRYEASNDWTQYSHKFSVVFSGAPEGTLTDFPVLVKISEYNDATGEGIPGFSYADCLRPCGGDLRFCDENGTLLCSEVDTWDESGISSVWVKVPTLTSATKITAYYGWSLAPSVDPAPVWSNGFLGVWHLGDESASAMADSTGGGSTLYEESWYSGSVGTGRSGAVGKAAEFGLRDSDHKGGLRTSASRVMRCGQNAVTTELWAWQDDHDPADNTQRSSLIYELSTNNSTYPTIYEIYEANSSDHKGKIAMWADCDVGSFYLTPANAKPLLPRAEWNHIVFRYDGTDGGANIQNTAVISSGYSNRGAFDASIGTSSLFVGCKTTGTANSQYPGKLDEVRISSVARSDAWIKATYDTIKNNASFATYGEAKENRVSGFLVIIR